MNLIELFRRLSYGELSNLALAGSGSGDIQTAQRPKVLMHVNDGLRRLHTRFILREEQLILEQIEGVTQYRLSPDYAQSNAAIANTPYQYIIDAGDPFHGRLVRVTAVYDEFDNELPLNDIGRYGSVRTPQPDLLELPYARGGSVLLIDYQAYPPELVVEDLEETVPVPDVLVPALTAFVAGKIYSNMNGAENTAKGAGHMATYDALCADAELNNLVSASRIQTTDKFGARGFV